MGMRGNSSRSLELQDVQIPAENLLGNEGDQIWYVFNVITPYFLVAMAGTYLGVASAAFDDPFAALSPDHLYLLATVASFRDSQAAGAEVDALTIEEAKDALAELDAEGIDVDGLLAHGSGDNP